MSHMKRMFSFLKEHGHVVGDCPIRTQAVRCAKCGCMFYTEGFKIYFTPDYVGGAPWGRYNNRINHELTCNEIAVKYVLE